MTGALAAQSQWQKLSNDPPVPESNTVRGKNVGCNEWIRNAPLQNPRCIDGLQLWLDGNDAGTVFEGTNDPAETGDAVTEWLDKSGNGNHVTAAATAEPIWTANLLNGKPVLVADGSNDRMTNGNIAGLNSMTSYTMYVIMSRSFTSGNRDWLNVQQTDGVDVFRSRWVPANGNLAWLSVTDAGNVTSTRGLGNVDQYYVRKATWDGTNQRWYFEGANDTDAITGTTTANQVEFVIFDGDTSSQNHGGGIAEFMFYNRLLSTSEQARVEAYILSKWGI